MIIAVDFDGTLMDPNNVRQGYRMGQPEPGAILSMQRLKNQGHTLVIFTARNVQHPNQHKAVADWLTYFKIPFDGITNIKRPEFEVMIDNRALHFDTWPQVMTRLRLLSQAPSPPTNHPTSVGQS